LCFGAEEKLANNHPGLNRFSEAHFISDEESPPVGADDIMREQYLVGKQVGPAIAQFAAAVLEGYLVCKLLEEEIERIVNIACGQSVAQMGYRPEKLDWQAFQAPAGRLFESDIGLVDSS
jgi:hypothetical protein